MKMKMQYNYLFFNSLIPSPRSLSNCHSFNPIPNYQYYIDISMCSALLIPSSSFLPSSFHHHHHHHHPLVIIIICPGNPISSPPPSINNPGTGKANISTPSSSQEHLRVGGNGDDNDECHPIRIRTHRQIKITFLPSFPLAHQQQPATAQIVTPNPIIPFPFIFFFFILVLSCCSCVDGWMNGPGPRRRVCTGGK
jgi:hypothetical protein